METATKAAVLLNNPEFMELIREEQSLLLESMANTQPHETKTRESLYFQNHAISSFIDNLKLRFEKGRQIIESLEHPGDEEDITD